MIKNKGIQKGMSAASEESKKLDSSLKKAARDFTPVLRKNNIQFMKKLDKEQFNIKIGCEPDGGIWLKNNIPVAAFEAKKQGSIGNAIERWYKNNRLLTRLNKDIIFVTFCSGSGVEPGKYLYQIAINECGGSSFLNEIVEPGDHQLSSWFLSKEGFTPEQIVEVMKKVLLKLC